jgi:virginiamycin B lyase
LPSQPIGIAGGSDGNVWVTAYAYFVNVTSEGAVADELVRISPAGEMTEFSLVPRGGGPSLLASGADGALWFTEPVGGAIGRMTTAGTYRAFALPAVPPPFDTRELEAIVAGPAGRVWFIQRMWFTLATRGRTSTVQIFGMTAAGALTRAYTNSGSDPRGLARKIGFGACAEASGQQRRTGRQRLAHELGDGA